jgi:hypothetical protein
MATRFDLRHARLTPAAALAAPTIEFMLFGVLITFGGIATEPAAAFTAVLMSLSLTHAWFVLASHYEVTSSGLRIVHGPWRRDIKLTDVLAARPQRTLDRGPVVQVRLAYGRELCLTPRDRAAFLDALEAHIAHLEVDAVEAATRLGS